MASAAKPITPQLIGKVKITDLNIASKQQYSDGPIEDKLLNYFKNNPGSDGSELLTPAADWPTTYHLSKVRQNLLNWMDFPPGSTVLEIGAGCGALTGLLASKAKRVVAVELSARRASINAYRHSHLTNLEIVIGNIDNLQQFTQERFDYVVCVGVLEYAGMFVEGKDPFRVFAEQLRKFTSANGKLVLAIENKLGLKYLSGAKEDHTQRYLEGVEGYPHYHGVRTFGRAELSNLLDGAGYGQADFYFPLPDYKLPAAVYSEKYLPGVHTPNIPSDLYPSPTPDQPRAQIMREQLVVRSFANNEMFGSVANSFLVIASPAKTKAPAQPVFARSAISRSGPFRLITKIYGQGYTQHVIKSPLTSVAKGHIANILANYSLLKKSVSSPLVNICPVKQTADGNLKFDFIAGPTMQNLLTDYLIASNKQAFTEVIDSYLSIIDSLPSKTVIPASQKGYAEIFGPAYKTSQDCILPAIIDINFDNIIVGKKGKSLIDYEWVFNFAVPKKYIVGRSMMYFFARNSQAVRATTGPDNPAIKISDDVIIPLWFYQKYEDYLKPLKNVLEAEYSFQKYVLGKSKKMTLYPQPEIADKELPDNVVDSYETLQAHFKHLQSALETHLQELGELQGQLEQIKSTNAWKLASKIQRLRGKINPK